MLASLVQPGSRTAAVAEALRSALAEVEEVFERELASDLPAVNALCRHVERYRGKLLRPTLVLLSGMALRDGVGGGDGTGPVCHAHRVVAAVIEMIHMATLVHDDVLDEADVRRQGATVNHLRGNEVAVMLGDYLISSAFHLCSTLGDPAINLHLGETTTTLCEGELVQLHHRENMSLDERTYFEIVRRKTAVLVGACCALGASLAGADASIVDGMRRFGVALGTAFQIQDDLLDLAGQPDVVGKTLGRDLEKGKLTLPLILHLAGAPPERRAESIELIRRREADRLLPRVLEDGAVAAARERAAALVEDGKRELAAVAPSPARDLLAAMADAVIAREA